MAWYGGTRGRHSRRTTVNECAWMLWVGPFARGFVPKGSDGPVVFRVAWRANGRPRFTRIDAEPTWMLARCPHDWRMRVQLEPRPWPIYGRRWFFRCSRCDRRCDRLYAERVGDPLHCRVCQKLTYASAQRWDHVARTGRFPGLLGRMVAAAGEGDDPMCVLRRARFRR